MTRPSQRDFTHNASVDQKVDQEIASLLTAIEQEKVPDRLTELAVALQNALIQKRRCETHN
ncbi:hypothetical protein LB553_10015 [Mesorhizobium sp. CA8]|uniref:hypothetical protein n=1 Tax=Mesorhizobium sp. CA8 TaxID=2876637 RepID=UPI001CC98427|nr:hypothetical protein [Mesorhizobium sp. CA8]MBZ9761210.1 hypothetical protein [Mesorhizobium sp. CA8]